jgi:tetratricopeptide (TPR) repeat protein
MRGRILTAFVLLLAHAVRAEPTTSPPVPAHPAEIEMRAAPARRAGLAWRDLLQQGVAHTHARDWDAADAIWQQLRALDPAHPAAPVFEVYTLYWRQVVDLGDTRYDEAIRRGNAEAIRLARARVEAAPQDAEAHFYAGQAWFHRARLEGTRGHMLSAASHARRATDHLKIALEIDPTLVDAKLPIGMYQYFVGILPRFFRWLSWLWFLPTGDAPAGLRNLGDVYENGDLYRWDAAFLLTNIFTYHEPGQKHRALAMARALHARFPTNALFHHELLEVLFEAGFYDEVVAEAAILEARPGPDGIDASVRRQARAVRARAELNLGRPEVALELLESFGPDGPEHPPWGRAWVLLIRGQALDAVGERARAVAHYKRVANLEPSDGSARAEELAKAGLAAPFAPVVIPSVGAAP